MFCCKKDLVGAQSLGFPSVGWSVSENQEGEFGTSNPYERTL